MQSCYRAPTPIKQIPKRIKASPMNFCFVIASATNDRQVRAVVDAIEERLRGIGAKPVRREGEREGRWVLLDYADIVVHVQLTEEREYYQLERLWKDCPLVAFDERAAQVR